MITPIAQGEFAVYHPEPGEHGVAHPRQELHFPNGVPSRARIEAVEVTHCMDETDYAKITFRDPHQAMVGYIAAMLLEGNIAKYEQWSVKCGYREEFEPMPEQWAWLSGFPQLEFGDFSDDVPSPTIMIVGETDLLNHNRTKHGHWGYHTESDTPIRDSIQLISDHYGFAGPEYGRLGEPGEAFDKLEADIKERWEDDPTRQWEAGDIGLTLGRDLTREMMTDFFFGHGGQRDVTEPLTDYGYLTLLRQVMSAYYAQHFEANPPVGVQDSVWSAVYTNKDKIVVKVKNGKLYFCRQIDLYEDLDRLTIFDYKMGRRNIHRANFATVQTQQQGWMAFLAELIGGDSTEIARYIEKDLEEIVTEAQQVMAPVAGSATPGDSPPPTPKGPPRPLYYISMQPVITEDWKRGDIEWLAGHLASNLKVTATVRGSPWVHAGSLVGLRGLAPGAETEPDLDERKWQRVNHYERIYVARKATHRVTSNGLYTTELELIGAATDNTKALLEKAAEHPPAAEGILGMIMGFFGGGGDGGRI